MTRKQKAESKGQEGGHSPKKPKSENDNGQQNGEPAHEDITAEYEDFCKAIREHLSLDQMRQILEANGLDSSGSEGSVMRKWLVTSFIYLYITLFRDIFLIFEFAVEDLNIATRLCFFSMRKLLLLKIVN